MINRMIEPTSGRIWLDDRDTAKIKTSELRRGIGYVIQHAGLFPHRTVLDNVATVPLLLGVDKKKARATAYELLERVGLPATFAERYPAQLSGGQQQRIAVARAIVIEPDLLLFDEPLSALDAGLREEMRIELKRIQRTLGITTVFVTHDQSEALSMADRVIVLRDGRIEQEGTPDDVYNRPVSEFVARFFGQVNELTGTVVGTEGSCLVVRLNDRAAVKVAAAGQAPGSSIRLLLRAERLQIAPRFPREAGASVVTGTVVASDYLGMLARYTVDAGGLLLTALQPVSEGVLANGTAVEMRIGVDAWMAP
jgi:ABC-type proline/glycine betaine transport system ATPase subunit